MRRVKISKLNQNALVDSVVSCTSRNQNFRTLQKSCENKTKSNTSLSGFDLFFKNEDRRSRSTLSLRSSSPTGVSSRGSHESKIILIRILKFRMMTCLTTVRVFFGAFLRFRIQIFISNTCSKIFFRVEPVSHANFSFPGADKNIGQELARLGLASFTTK